MQYFIFSVFFPHKSVQSDAYFGSEIDLDLINFVKLNSDSIVKSVKDNDYNDLSKEINKLYFNNRCWELKINDKVFNIYNCGIYKPEAATVSIPDYNNNNIIIILNVNKK